MPDNEQLLRQNAELRAQEKQCSIELATANQALEAFSRSVSHDLRAPLRSLASLVQILDEDYGGQLAEGGRGVLTVIQNGCRSLDQMLEALLGFSRCVSQPLDLVRLDMTILAHEALKEVLSDYSGPAADVEIAQLPSSVGDAILLRQTWRNLINNALKFSSQRPQPRIRVSGRVEGTENIYQIEDNGAGFDMHYAHRLFGIFQRLHRADEFVGTGVGLAIAQRIVVRHGGRIWAHGVPESGASFQFAIPFVKFTGPNSL